MAKVTEERVQSILHGMSRLDDARELLAELNYDRANDPIPRRGWGEGAREALTDDPRIIAAHGEFQVIYCRLPGQKLQRTPERIAVNKLLQEHPYALFLFSNEDTSLWHFLNVKYDDSAERRRLFRRITIGPNEQLRTATERISRLDLLQIEPDLFGISPLTIQTCHDDAFNVERVTKEFFTTYRQVFEGVEGRIRGFADAAKKKLFTQKLFNRLMFLAFVQKKGWLRFGGDTDFLAALWASRDRSAANSHAFYHDRLKPLFFMGLNTPRRNKGERMQALIGDVPYLNGGLFEADEEDQDPKILVPDACVDAILNQLFARFNFTVTESTPLDVEVAVDPEMLGKVFEELVTGRHETGSYYTPKPVVSFMCREALKGHLKTALPGESQEAIEAFVEEHNADGLYNAEGVLEALRRVRACDPACGSGAYLLGMLHELLDLRSCLFVARHIDAPTTYQRKLEIIENNVYGVDLDLFAVNIARLRLWLSLAVEFEGEEGEDPPPLPNLDMKIERGDSLAAPNPRAAKAGRQEAFRHSFIRRLRDAKAEYMTAHDARKQRLRTEIAKLKGEIAAWAHAHGPVAGFDWAVEFAEVFLDQGFDVVLANPPYVRADAQFRHIGDEPQRQAAIAEWKEYRDALKSSGTYDTVYEKWDLYIPFLERAHQLIRPRGRMVFIIPDAYNAAKYTRKSHEFFLKNARIERLDFCTDIPLFEAGVTNTILHIARATPTPDHQPVRVRRWGDGPDDFEANSEFLPTAPQGGQGTTMFRAGRAPTATDNTMVPLAMLCYVTKGMVVHAEEGEYQGEFRLRDLVSPERDKRHPKPFVEGKDLTKWVIQKHHWIEYGTARAPTRLSRPTFPEVYEAPEKLISMDIAGSQPRVVYDASQLYHNHSAWSFVPWKALLGVVNRSITKTSKYRWQLPEGDREERESLSEQFHLKYVLAVMNSAFASDWLAARRRSKLHVYPDDWKGLPIAPLPKERQTEFVRLVDAILAKFKRHGYPLPPEAARQVADMEREIDERLAVLYGAQLPRQDVDKE